MPTDRPDGEGQPDEVNCEEERGEEGHSEGADRLAVVDVVGGAGAAEEGGRCGQGGEQEEAGEVRAQISVVGVERATAAAAEPLPKRSRPLLHGEGVAADLAGTAECRNAR